MRLDRRLFLAALAAPLVVKSNVGLRPWTPTRTQALMFGGVIPDFPVFISKNFFNHQDKLYRDYYAPRP